MRVPLLVTILLSAAGAVLATWPLADSLRTATLRDGEVLLTAWQLNSYHQALLGNPLAWADSNIFFPYDRTAAFNDLLMTHALVTLPVAWAVSPVLALNLALLGGIALTGLCAYLLIDELVDHPWASAIAAILFALTPFRFLHIGHLSITAAWPIPLLFWALLRHMRQPSWGRAALVAVTGVLVGLSSVYNAAFVAPIAPLVVLIGARRGPGGRAVWVPLLVACVPALALLGAFLAPFASALRAYGTAAAPDDLLRHGADLASLSLRPHFLDPSAITSPINAEAHLYPGAALLALAAGGLAAAAAGVRAFGGARRVAAIAALAVVAGVMIGLALPVPPAVRAAAALGGLLLVWIAPPLLAVSAFKGTTAGSAAGPAVAIRVGLAVAALAFALALGPEARDFGRAIGPAPYVLLTYVSSAFEGTRAPARFGGIMLLFLAVVASGVLAMLFRDSRRPVRLAGVAIAGAALAACAMELPLPPLPQGQQLVTLGPLRDRAYRWLADQEAAGGILELPDWQPDAKVDYRLREWRSLRYMLASKQHPHRLVNGSGRIEPFLWRRFRTIEQWSDEFFSYITSYFPVDYVLVHELGIPESMRDAVWARLGEQKWSEAFRSTRIRIYRVDRSAGRGSLVDRLVLRRDLAPRAEVQFSARTLGGAANGQTAVLELLRDGEVVAECAVDAEWRACTASVPVTDDVSNWRSEWPRTATLLRWQVRGDRAAAFELQEIKIGKGSDSREQ